MTHKLTGKALWAADGANEYWRTGAHRLQWCLRRYTLHRYEVPRYTGTHYTGTSKFSQLSLVYNECWQAGSVSVSVSAGICLEIWMNTNHLTDCNNTHRYVVTSKGLVFTTSTIYVERLIQSWRDQDEAFLSIFLRFFHMINSSRTALVIFSLLIFFAMENTHNKCH